MRDCLPLHQVQEQDAIHHGQLDVEDQNSN